MMKTKTLEWIDSLNTRIGKLVAWLVVLNVLVLVYEFFARYVFQRPTIWSFEVTYFIYGAHFLLGAGFTLFMKSHIRIDILYQRMKPKTQAKVDMVGYLVFFFPVMLVLIFTGGEFTYHSFQIGEKSGLSPWRPILYPFKAIMTFGFILLFLQGVAEFVRSFHQLTGRRE